MQETETLDPIKTRGRDEADTVDRLVPQIAKGAGITFLGDVFGKGVNFVSQIVIARLLGVELFGLYALGLVMLNVGQTLSAMGLAQGATRFVAIFHGEGNRESIKGTIIQTLTLPFLAGCVVGAALFCGADRLAVLFGNAELASVLRVVAFGIPFLATMMVAVAITRGFKKMQYFVYVKNVLHPVANLILVVLLYWLGFRLLGALTAWIVPAALGVGLTLYFIRKEFPEFSRVHATYPIRDLLRFSGPLVLVGFLQMVFFRTDVLMLGYFRTSTEVGIYNAVSQVMIALVMILMAFGSIFSPLVADLCSKNRFGELNRLFKIVSKWIVLMTLPIFIIIVLSSQELLNVFGSSFIAGKGALIILSVFFFLSIILGPVLQTLVMSGHQIVEFYNTFTAVILNIILNLFFIPIWGIEGAALATGISVFTLHLLRLSEVLYFLKLWPISNKYIGGLVVGLIVTIIGAVFRTTLQNVYYLHHIVLMALVVAVSFVMLLLFLGVDEEDKLVFEVVKRRIRVLWR